MRSLSHKESRRVPEQVLTDLKLNPETVEWKAGNGLMHLGPVPEGISVDAKILCA